LIVHLLRWVSDKNVDKNVDGESVRRAGLLIRYFASHARKVYAVLGADPEIEDARKVLGWIAREKRSEFKRHEVYNDVRNKHRFSRVEDLDQPLHRLAKHNYIRQRQDQGRDGPGRKGEPTWEVNPLWNHQINQTNQTDRAGAF
jgi:hypothetical protein